VVREEWGQGGEMTQALYARMNNKKIKIKKICIFWGTWSCESSSKSY
jgi:hypothetical protein